MSAPLLVALLTALLIALAVLEVVWGTRTLRRLVDFAPLDDAQAPTVSIIVAARDEAPHIEQAMRSLLALDYPQFEVIAVDDRSSDGTAEILDRLAAAEPRLRVLHVRELPPGWLGKNHALHLGASRAGGEWLLFTDADVHFAPCTLRRALHLATAGQLDHLALSLRIVPGGFWYNVTLGAFMLMFLLFARPWFVRYPRLPFHIGIGAFNLVRASAYRRVGGHAPIALRPDDDLKLGKLLKLRGCRQDMALGESGLTVAWYPGLRAMIHGLEKNAFSGVDYRPWLHVLGMLLLAWLFLGPFVMIGFSSGLARGCYLLAAALLLALQMAQAHGQGRRPLQGLFFPLGMVIMLYILAHAAWRNLRDGGITWRGTFYPLAQLRRNRL